MYKRQGVKCDGCADRVAEGKSPICVEACPLRALEFGDIEELRAKQMCIRDRMTFVESRRPPRPTSSTTMSQPWRAKCTSATAVISSNSVGWSVMASACSFTSNATSASSVSYTHLNYELACGFSLRMPRVYV